MAIFVGGRHHPNRIKHVSISVPSVTEPFAGVHCTMWGLLDCTRFGLPTRAQPAICKYQLALTMEGSKRMSAASRATQRDPIITFFFLIYVITWGFMWFGLFGAFWPLIAALIIALTRGRARLTAGAARGQSLARDRAGLMGSAP